MIEENIPICIHSWSPLWRDPVWPRGGGGMTDGGSWDNERPKADAC